MEHWRLPLKSQSTRKMETALDGGGLGSVAPGVVPVGQEE